MKRREPVHEGALTELDRGRIAGLWARARTDDEARVQLAALLRELAPSLGDRERSAANAAYYPVRLGAWNVATPHIEALLGVAT